MADAVASALYVGQVSHVRLRPFRHAFRYRLFLLLLDLDELPLLAHRSRLLRFNRRGLVAFHERDHGARDGSALRPWIERRLLEAGLDPTGGRIRLLCMPRILGYVFNPLSVWYCHRRDGQLQAILYEVRNTFGQAHSYLIPVTQTEDGIVQQACDKCFYVSPFIGMTAHYHFRVAAPGERLTLTIRQEVPEGAQLLASVTGRRRTLDDATLLAQLLRIPALTLKVILAIHWQALRLWLKGARFHRRPAPPAVAVSIVRPDAVPDARPAPTARLEAAE